MSYNPQVPPQDPDKLLTYLQDEFFSVAQSYNPQLEGMWEIKYKLPVRVEPGMLQIFDGTNANPAGVNKEGLYRYGRDNLWHFVEGVPYTPPPDPTPEAWTVITSLSNGWTVAGDTGYRKFNYTGTLVINVAPGTLPSSGSGVVIFNLPVGYRPAFNMNFPVSTNTLGDISGLPYCRVLTNGNVELWNIPTGVSRVFATLTIAL